MKIISKHKDYYDYLQGEFGIDEKIVYTRNCYPFCIKDNDFTDSKYAFAICGRVYFVEQNEDGDWDNVEYFKEFKNRLKKGKFEFTNLNKITNEPILMLTAGIGWISDENDFLNNINHFRVPLLKNSPIPSLISPKEMWQLVYNFLSQQISDKETTVILSDKEKIVNKGFDLKSSFRGK
jgi:hypothetical protein